MSKLPSLTGKQLIAALGKAGFAVNYPAASCGVSGGITKEKADQ